MTLEGTPLCGRILVVDDSPDDLALMERRLSRLGHSACAVGSGEAALEALERESFDAVLLDIVMPGLDGITTLQRIRARPSAADLPIIIVSGKDGGKDIAAALAAGANDYVTKPIDFAVAAARLEAQLARRRTAGHLRTALADAQAAVQDKSEFLATMSHELRTPLNAIIGFADLICARPADRSRIDWAESIRASGEHLLALVNNSIEMARSGLDAAIQLEPIVIAEACRTAMTLVRPLGERNGNTLVMACDPECGVLVSDPLKLNQCLLNLLGNACKFTRDGTVTLTARLRREGASRFVEFAVADTGIGIATEHHHRLFHLFSQADESIGRRFGGNGVGLAVTARFATLLRGRVEFVSAAGEGSVFSLLLPAQEASAMADESSPEPPLVTHA
jgi:signal transduction histidine kinase